MGFYLILYAHVQRRRARAGRRGPASRPDARSARGPVHARARATAGVLPNSFLYHVSSVLATFIYVISNCACA